MELEAVIVHVAAFEAKPEPVTVLSRFLKVMEGEMLRTGLTVKVADPVSITVPLEGQLTVTVYDPLSTPLATSPTLKVP